jgi:uncharacterized protein YjbJ (UPF0337 family)
MEEKAKGRMKEAAGAVTGDEAKKAEGRAQQRKDAAGEEATQKAKTRHTEKGKPGRPRGTSSAARPRAGGCSGASRCVRLGE